MYSIPLSIMHFRKIISMPRTMVDYQQTVLTKTEISEKRLGVCKCHFQCKKIYAINQKKKLRSLFEMTNFEKRQQGYDAG